MFLNEFFKDFNSGVKPNTLVTESFGKNIYFRVDPAKLELAQAVSKSIAFNPTNHEGVWKYSIMKNERPEGVMRKVAQLEQMFGHQVFIKQLDKAVNQAKADLAEDKQEWRIAFEKGHPGIAPKTYYAKVKASSLASAIAKVQAQFTGENFRQDTTVSEGGMNDLDIQRQDYRDLNPQAFFQRYKMTKDAWSTEHRNLLVPPKAKAISKSKTKAPNAVEASGYAYNRRDQRVMWNKAFASEEAANAWAKSKNATILRINPIGQ